MAWPPPATVTKSETAELEFDRSVHYFKPGQTNVRYLEFIYYLLFWHPEFAKLAGAPKDVWPPTPRSPPGDERDRFWRREKGRVGYGCGCVWNRVIPAHLRRPYPVSSHPPALLYTYPFSIPRLNFFPSRPFPSLPSSTPPQLRSKASAVSVLIFSSFFVCDSFL